MPTTIPVTTLQEKTTFDQTSGVIKSPTTAHGIFTTSTSKNTTLHLKTRPATIGSTTITTENVVRSTTYPSKTFEPVETTSAIFDQNTVVGISPTTAEATLDTTTTERITRYKPESTATIASSVLTTEYVATATTYSSPTFKPSERSTAVYKQTTVAVSSPRITEVTLTRETLKTTTPNTSLAPLTLSAPKTENVITTATAASTTFQPVETTPEVSDQTKVLVTSPTTAKGTLTSGTLRITTPNEASTTFRPTETTTTLLDKTTAVVPSPTTADHTFTTETFKTSTPNTSTTRTTITSSAQTSDIVTKTNTPASTTFEPVASTLHCCGNFDKSYTIYCINNSGDRHHHI
ncbi:uncharacterized protein LOC144987088 [Oryzias latipes]